jgi:putative peptide zinc metalloprotease protein
MADGMAGPNLHIVVSSIDKDASPTLNEAELATLFGGHIAVREKNGAFYPEHAIYRVVLNVIDQSAPLQQHRWRGSVTLVADWEAPGARFVNSALSVFWREAGF